MRSKPTKRIIIPSKRQPIESYFKNAGKPILKDALLYWLSVAMPAFGAVAIPLYTAGNYLTLAGSLYKICGELMSKKKVDRDSIGEVSESAGEFSTQRSADKIASAVVAKVGQLGLFEEMTKKTRVSGVVFSGMLKGSIGSALSASGGELAKFVIGKMVSA